MIIEATIAADRTMPTLAIGIADDRLREHVRVATQRLGLAVVTERAAAQVIVSDAIVSAAQPVVVIGTQAALVDAFERGAAGGLKTDFSLLQFERALLAVAAGLRCFDLPPTRATVTPLPSVDHALADESDTTGAPLTVRESEVLALLTTGASNKHIARALGISVHTAKFHVASIIAKLGAKGRTEVVVRTLSAGKEMI